MHRQQSKRLLRPSLQSLSDFSSAFSLSKADIQRDYAGASPKQNELPISAKKMLHNNPNMV
jgi:hypothetical protein